MPILERHREFIGLSFLCNLLKYNVDCSSILHRLQFKLNSRHLRNVQFFHLGFSPLNVLVMIYNSCSGFLLDSNVNNVTFKFKFFHNF